MLFGRERESARIDELLNGARGRRGGALVLRGETGIGKTALLNDAIERAAGMRVLRALGVESEVEIVCSGLHELFVQRFVRRNDSGSTGRGPSCGARARRRRRR